MRIFKYAVAAILILTIVAPSIRASENRSLWSESSYVQSAKIHYRHVYKKSKRREDLYHCIDLLREAADKYGHRPNLYYQLGMYYAEINAIDTVIAYFDSVETFCADELIEEKYRKHCYKKDNYKKGMMNLRKDRWETAYIDAVDYIEQYDTVMIWMSLSLTDDSTAVLQGKADTIFDLAETGFREALLVLPEEPRTFGALAALYQRREMSKEMVELLLQESAIVGESDELTQEIAYAYISIPDWENTIIWYEKYLANNPTDVGALINLSLSYRAVDNTAKWYEYAERVLEVDPQNSQMMVDLGQYWNMKMQDVTAAQGEINDSTPGGEGKRAELEAKRIESLDKAMEKFNQAHAIDPEDLSALRWIGILCLLSGDKDKTGTGIDAFEKYIAIDPNDVDILDYLGRAYINNGDTKGAIKPYEMLVEIDPGLVDAWERLTELYNVNKMPEKSKAAQAKAEELSKI